MILYESHYRIHCDKRAPNGELVCRNVTGNTHTKQRAIKIARQLGWFIEDDEKAYCPDHNPSVAETITNEGVL
jgi:hypothetical protein